MADETKRRGLGRGLSALIGADDLAPAPGRQRAPDTTLAIDLLAPSSLQPRRVFDEERLDELAASIRARGVIQPILVRPAPNRPGHYEIIAGERRWRAAQRARLHAVPAVIREASDEETLELAIIENVQRADLNPIEEAAGYRRLIEEFGHTQDALGRLLGKSRSHVANTLRLLNLPPQVQDWLRQGRLTAGHARAVAAADAPLPLARRIVDQGLSVRQAEALARGEADPPPRRAKPAAAAKDADTRALEGDLSAALGCRVVIDHRGEGGELRITYGNLEMLDRLCAILSAAR
jgi:ParB family chromosome partitioning protein